jgi:hypothetical protein
MVDIRNRLTNVQNMKLMLQIWEECGTERFYVRSVQCKYKWYIIKKAAGNETYLQCKAIKNSDSTSIHHVTVCIQVQHKFRGFTRCH